MSWILLLLTGYLEIGWAVGLKYTEGFRNLGPTVASVGAMVLMSIVLLGLSMRELPLGTAYAVWTGIRNLGTVIIGIMLFGEPANLVRVGCIVLIVVGIGGLKLTAW